METPKRKTKTSSAVKNRYNKKTYTAVTAMVNKDIAAEFKAKCAAEDIPQSQIIKKAIEEYLKQ